MKLYAEGSCLVLKKNGETLRIEPWGEDGLRVRASMHSTWETEDWALSQPKTVGECTVRTGLSAAYTNDGNHTERPYGEIIHGRIRAVVNLAGVISFYRDNQLMLREYYRKYEGTISEGSRCLNIVNREWKPILGASEYKLTVKFDANEQEQIFGMGQYQQPYLNLKGCVLELMQRNSQISVPFMVSSLGYGLLWNNPAVGSVAFGRNYTEWTAESTREMDYWITVADTPRELLRKYTQVTGRAPAFPEELMGMWQCKLRYRTQDEVLSVARKYHELGIKLDQIVIDFFHWTLQGDWQFDAAYWPDPKAMVQELHEMGIKVMVSVWPSIDRRSPNFWPAVDAGLVIRTERGVLQTYDYQGNCTEIDAFNPEARAFIWEKCKASYLDAGFDGFWLDNSEPDLSAMDMDNYRYCIGPALTCSNAYPQMFSRAFDEPMRERNQGSFVNLIRSGWAGSQRLSNVIWSGDVPSTFQALREQLQGGLNMGLAGIPWWTTDIGGFMTDDVNDPKFQQLLIRWYQLAAFSPVLRLHGQRGPFTIPPLDHRDRGGGYLYTGQPNEMWSYGEENFRIMRKYLDIRHEMHDYLASLFAEAQQNGSPLMRTMFYEFPDDPVCWQLQDQYMLGSQLLVAPVLYLDQFERDVYLPQGTWKPLHGGEPLAGGQTIHVQAPLDRIPVFRRMA